MPENEICTHEKVLITGASGLVGTRLSALLLKKGYEVNTLGRKINRPRSEVRSQVNSYVWNLEKGEVDAKAFEGVSAVIHLAGAGVADKRWSEERKKEIVESRVQSAKLIFDFEEE